MQATSLTTLPAPITAAPITAAPTPAPTTPPTAAPTQPPVQATSLTTQPGPTTTTTIVVTAGDPPPCTAAAIALDTGMSIAVTPVCRAGWAVLPGPSCAPGATACAESKVFQLTSRGWVLSGTYDLSSSCRLIELGMSAAVATAFGPCPTAPSGTTVIHPGTSGAAVVALQVALVAEGYPIGVDGTYGPRTQAAVRDFQRRHGLEVDGIAGPHTQFALGIGPDPSGAGNQPAATTTTPAPSTVAPTTSTAGGTAGTSTTIVTAGTPRECTAEAITADVGNAVAGTVSCAAGWAVERTTCGNHPCQGANVFHAGSGGWSLRRDVLGEVRGTPHRGGDDARHGVAVRPDL